MCIGGWKDGAEILGNVEWRKYYTQTETFTKNFKAPIYSKLEDVPDDLEQAWKGADIVFGHPECGNFSNLRVRKTAKLKDPSDLPLFADLVRYCSTFLLLR